MQMMKWSVMALAIAAATTQLAVASSQSESKGFVEDSDLQLLNRNYFFQRDFKNNAPGKNKTQEWAHGVTAELTSGFTQGTVGFGVDTYAFMGLKLDSGDGRNGTGLLPIDGDGSAEDQYGEAGGAVKARISNSVLKYGEMRTSAPVFATSHSRLLPETATGFNAFSEEIENLALEGGYFTAYNNRASTNSDDELLINYGSGEAGKSIGFLGGAYTFSDDLSVTLYGSKFDETWNQYYLNTNYTLGISEDQNLNFDLNLYNTSDTGAAYQGDISNTTFSLAAAYNLGYHSFLVAHQSVDGDTPFDYVGGDSIFLSNSMQYSDFNGANEKSWRIGYTYDWTGMDVPGLTTMATYVKGTDVDGTKADVNGGYAGLQGKDGEHTETNLDIKYVVQEGPAKDLSVRLRQAFHYANADQGEGDIHEFRVIVDYPLDIM
jgi:imipenem/basic amino acid-specific outer membrane pore